jgi:Fic family protein
MKMPERPPFIGRGYNYADLLDELIKIGKLNEIFDINDNKYPYWDKWKYKAKEWEYDEKKLWAVVKSNRLSSRVLHFSSFQDFDFTIGAPSIVQKYLHEFDLNLGGSLQGESIIPAEDRDRYLINSLMEEAIASSQLEGAVTTRKVAKEMLEGERKPRNTSEQMILNNYEGMKWIVANKDLPFTPDNIRLIHKIITKNTLSLKSEEGTLRQDDEIKIVDVQTGATIYTPPPHEQLEQLIEDYCLFANDQDKPSFFIHPIAKGIALHFLMGYIHPFADGNGRTARTIFYWYLLKKGYWLIEYMSVSSVILGSKAQYAKAYLHTELDDNDLTYFLLYNLKSIQTALNDLKKYIQQKTAEKQQLMHLLRNAPFNERQVAMLQDLIQDPGTYLSVQLIQNRFAVSNQTARNDLNGLVEAGLLDYLKRGSKMQFFPVKDFIKRMDKVFK